MKPEAQHIAMAELDGFRRVDRPEHRPELCENDWINEDGRVAYDDSELPDYLSNGDAVRAVARKLNPIQKEHFIQQLGILVCAEIWPATMQGYLKFVLASPSEITEAVLWATGKWMETK